MAEVLDTVAVPRTDKIEKHGNIFTVSIHVFLPLGPADGLRVSIALAFSLAEQEGCGQKFIYQSGVGLRGEERLAQPKTALS